MAITRKKVMRFDLAHGWRWHALTHDLSGQWHFGSMRISGSHSRSRGQMQSSLTIRTITANEHTNA